MAVSALILAAGQGTRMKSPLPKPLHLVAGRSMLMHVVYSLTDLSIAHTIIVVGHNAHQVVDHVTAEAPRWAHIGFATQEQQHGTGDATKVGLSALPKDEISTTILVLPGDTPLLTQTTMARLIAEHESSLFGATILTSVVEDPTGYGRIVRDDLGEVQRIVEQRDANPTEILINEINTGIYAFQLELLVDALNKIDSNNSQAEYYLTDVIAILRSGGYTIGASAADPVETAGVNDPEQLASANLVMQARLRQ